MIFSLILNWGKLFDHENTVCTIELLLKAISSHKSDEIQLSLGLAVYFEYLLGWKIPRSDKKQNIHTGAVARQLLQLWPISFRYKPLGSVISKKKHFIQVISLWQCARCNKYSNQPPNPVIAGFHPRNDLKLPLVYISYTGSFDSIL